MWILVAPAVVAWVILPRAPRDSGVGWRGEGVRGVRGSGGEGGCRCEAAMTSSAMSSLDDERCRRLHATSYVV